MINFFENDKSPSFSKGI